MTPQERQLVAELFDRLAALESSPRDQDAERTIGEGQQRAPHALYALVQTVLVQDEALKRAHARIQDLEGRPAEEPSRGFLDNMRETLFGREERRGSVPPVRQGGLGSSGAWGEPAGGPPSGMSMAPAGVGPSPIGSGGSFLGTAAASAAGVIGGAMLLNSIRSMFGPHSGAAAAYDPAAAASSLGGSAANSDLARQAGLAGIGRDDDASGGPRRGLLGGDDQSGDSPASHDDDGNYHSDDDGNDDYDNGNDDYDDGDFGDTEDV